MKMGNSKTIVGVDEAGRGPLAGPVYAAAVAATPDFDISVFPGLDGSKQLSEQTREELFDQIMSMETDDLVVEYAYGQPQTIDTIGINSAVRRALNRCLRRIHLSTSDSKLLLDGGLQAPDKYDQETIIKGDQKVPEISLASVVAKVARDRKIRRLDSQYPNFAFSRHKGYGTKRHRKNINNHGPTDIHRLSFLRTES